MKKTFILPLLPLLRFLLIGVAMVGLFAVPEDNNPHWLLSLILSKLIAAAAIVAIGLLRGYEAAAVRKKRNRPSREAACPKRGAKPVVY